MAQLGKNDQRRKAQGRVFALIPQDVQASDTVVTGILPLFSNFAKTLFDSGSTHSFILCNSIIKSCVIQIEDKKC